jgi:hypothetical protein
MQCAKCGKKYSAVARFLGEGGLKVRLYDKEATLCRECYEKLYKEYKAKKTCEDCFYFDDEFCKKLDFALTPTKFGIIYETEKTYYLEADECVHFITKDDYKKKALRGKAIQGGEGAREKEIIREKEVIIKVKCPYCGKLYNETFDVCPHCGGKR